MKILIIIFFLLSNICILLGQNTIFNNSEFNIKYSILDDSIKIFIQDLKDHELNWLHMGYSDDNLMYGKMDVEYNDGQIDRNSDSFDGCNIEFDINNDGKLTPEDKAYYIWQSKQNGEPIAYYLGSRYYALQHYDLEHAKNYSNGICIIKKTSSKVQATLNPYLKYEFTIPVDEIVNINDFKIRFRILVDRTCHYQRYGVSYKTFVLPDNQSLQHSKDEKFFEIDLSLIKESKIQEYIVKIKKEQDLAVQRRSDAIILRKLYTKEAQKKATKVLPKYDGLFIETALGSLIEIPRQKCNYGRLWEYTYIKHLIYDQFEKEPLNPYYTEECFDTLHFIQIEKSNIKSLKVVAGGELKNAVNFLSFHEINRYPLKNLNGGKYVIFNEAPNDNYNYGEMIFNTYMYWFDNPKLVFNRQSNDNIIYTYNPAQSLKEGKFYGAWAGRNIWVFEVVPDKPKPVSVTTSQPKNSSTSVKKTNSHE